MKAIDNERLVETARSFLLHSGVNLALPGRQRTPRRMADWMQELTMGQWGTLEAVVNGAVFRNEGCDEIILVKDIHFVSLCEHHVLPFIGTAAVGYLPSPEWLIGLSKIARIVELYAKRLQMQERLTVEISNALWEVVQPRGVGVVLTATHFCQTIRGAKQAEATMTTSSMLGLFRESASARAEFFELLKQQGGT